MHRAGLQHCHVQPRLSPAEDEAKIGFFSQPPPKHRTTCESGASPVLKDHRPSVLKDTYSVKMHPLCLPRLEQVLIAVSPDGKPFGKWMWPGELTECKAEQARGAEGIQMQFVELYPQSFRCSTRCQRGQRWWRESVPPESISGADVFNHWRRRKTLSFLLVLVMC